jgi:hypothetical protein
MISKELCKEVLGTALSSGADYGEIFAERTLAGSLYMVDSRLDEISDSVKSGAGVRVMKGTRTVYGTTTDLSREALLALAKRVSEALGEGSAPISIRLEDKKIESRHPVFRISSETPKSEKLEAAEAIRIVDVEGFDRCACCAPHLDSAGKVGLIKIVDAMHYKGGMRFSALCGFDALADYDTRLREIRALSSLFSAKPHEVVSAAEAKMEEIGELKGTISAMRREIISLKLALIAPTEESILRFESDMDAASMREFATTGAQKTKGIFAVFAGSDETGYRFTAVSEHIPLKKLLPEIKAKLGGKCGGSDQMLTGQIAAKESDIRAFFGNATNG